MFPRALVSDKKGRIRDIPGLAAAGMKGGSFFKLAGQDLISLPPHSRLFMLPQRRFNGGLPVAAFVPPGFTATYSPAYVEEGKPPALPLFSYAACAFYKGGFYAACVRVDRERRHDPQFIDINLVRKNIPEFRKIFPKNRLVRHLENCALIYGCPGAQNFFLNRYEGPLPVSPLCNASCMGCISHKLRPGCSGGQPRIKFIPSPEEITEAALFHIRGTGDPVVSFGQGCEGEPLLAADIIERSIKLIRRRTDKGMINMNTNASRPHALSRLFDAGLDSIRVSLNSARQEYYNRYYRPRGYGFNDVLRSINIARKKDKFVSVNYLTMPGFTDSKDEVKAFKKFIGAHSVDMVQWRNLNFDPLQYFRLLKISVQPSDMLGIKETIASMEKTFPRVMMGCYNPSKGRIKRKMV